MVGRRMHIETTLARSPIEVTLDETGSANVTFAVAAADGELAHLSDVCLGG